MLGMGNLGGIYMRVAVLRIYNMLYIHGVLLSTSGGGVRVGYLPSL